MNNKVSIIVPVYNTEMFLKRCIDSILNQTYGNIEAIFINDGSTDRSLDILNNYKDRIIIVNQKNQGQAVARNKALNYVAGDYLMFVDSDDFIEKNMIKDMMELMLKEKTSIVMCDYYLYYDDNNKSEIALIPHHSNEKYAHVIGMPGPVCRIFKKSLFQGEKFLEGRIFEDNAIIPYICSKSSSYSYLKKPLYYYYQRAGSSLNTNGYNKKNEDIYFSLDYLCNKFIKNNSFKSYYSELEYIYIEYLLHASNLRFIKYKKSQILIKKTSLLMKEKFPNWRKNKYYKKENIKYKIICNLFYYNKITILNILLNKKGR